MRLLSIFPRNCHSLLLDVVYSLPFRTRTLTSAPPTRQLCSSACADRTITVPVGSNGRLSLRITRPKDLSAGDHQSVILLLPAGPLFSVGKLKSDYAGDSGDHGGVAARHALALATSSTVVAVNYRLGQDIAVDTPSRDSSHAGRGGQQGELTCGITSLFHKYPTPVHDTLAGLDWVLEKLQPARLSVLGMHIGGSLALMLALTESKSLYAVGTLEPVCDWVELDEYCTIASGEDKTDQVRHPWKGKGTRSKAPSDLVPLLHARKSFFQSPERYFDAFASPLLFLRSAGSDVPRRFPEYLTGPDYPIPILKEPAGDEDSMLISQNTYTSPYYEEVSTPLMDAELDSGLFMDPGDIHRGKRRRKSLSRWPPFGLDYDPRRTSASKKNNTEISHLEMALPWVRVYIREHWDEPTAATKRRPQGTRRSAPRSVLESQSNEMVSVMRRACFWGREPGFAEEKVTLISTQSEHWIHDAGEWLSFLLSRSKS